MRRRHGDIEKLLIGDQVVLITSNLRESVRIPIDPPPHTHSEHGITVTDVEINGEKLFRFNYMFRDAGLPSFEPDPDHLAELGLAMTNTAGVESKSSLRAGYTFLGQFIDHDLSFNANEDLSIVGPPVQLKSKRSPSLDLDSLYGFEPAKVMNTELGMEMYDGAKLKVGVTVPDQSSLPSTDLTYPHDLHRLPSSKQAALVDSRNDENLAVAQTHLAFIKFHNAMVDHLSGSVSPAQLFWEARREVIRHYQRVILDDFLPSILDPTVITQIQQEGPQHFRLMPGEEPFMPLEFAFAAFRMGHSLVTSAYEWNSVFQSAAPQPQPASLEELFIFSGSGTLNNHWNITSNWIIDWTRFFDFSDFQVTMNEPSSQAGTIDAVIARRLAELAPIPNQDISTRSLAVRNLLRGRSVSLPAGQDVADHLDYDSLEPEDFSDLPYYSTLQKFEFDERTPLWLYILQEAKIRHDGERLGPVGSRIIGETLVTLIEASRTTILPPGTKWKTPQENEKFGMANLLVFVKDASKNKDFLNPLG